MQERIVMDLYNIGTAGGIVLIVLTLVQISPLKINPWSYIAKVIGRAINGEILEEVNKLKKEIDGMRKENSEQNAVNCRARILRFGDECLHGVKHTKDHFDQTLRDITAYERYCASHKDFENDITELTSKRIKAIYSHCLDTNDFL